MLSLRWYASQIPRQSSLDEISPGNTAVVDILFHWGKERWRQPLVSYWTKMHGRKTNSFGWTFLKKLGIVSAKPSHHNNLKHPCSVTDIPKGIPSIPHGGWDPACPSGPELFWHVLYPIKSYFSHLSEQPFTWLTQALTPCQPQGRVVGSQRIKDSISPLLSQGGHPLLVTQTPLFWILSSDTKACCAHPGLCPSWALPTGTLFASRGR